MIVSHDRNASEMDPSRPAQQQGQRAEVVNIAPQVSIQVYLLHFV